MAQTKPDKSEIISGVVSHVRQTGRFVKRCPNTGKWMHAEDLLCREKCSQCFRDALHQTYRSSNVAKKNKRRRELDMQFQHDEDNFAWAPEMKRMRPNPAPLPPLAAPEHLFDWEMSPLVPKPRIFRRASDLTGNMVSLLADAFGGNSFHDIDNVDENPFEPTPLPIASAQNCSSNGWDNGSNVDPLMKDGISFEPTSLLDTFLQDDSLEDFSFKTDFMDGSSARQPQQQQTSEYQYLGPNIAAAFAA